MSMEVMPVGEQRDRQVAELRDGIASCQAAYHVNHYCGAKSISACVSRKCKYHAHEKTSTNITAAFELWGEMKANGYLPNLTVNENSVDVSFHCASYSDIDEAAAISGAYIKWKGGESWTVTRLSQTGGGSVGMSGQALREDLMFVIINV